MVSNAFEARRSVASSRTRRASPSTIRCMSPASVVMTQRPSAARFRLFLAVPFEATYSADSDQTANNGMTCGAPFGRTVASQNQPPCVSRSSKSSHRTGRELPASPAAAVPFPSRDIASPAGLWCIIRISPILSYAFVPLGYTVICCRLGVRISTPSSDTNSGTITFLTNSPFSAAVDEEDLLLHGFLLFWADVELLDRSQSLAHDAASSPARPPVAGGMFWLSRKRFV